MKLVNRLDKFRSHSIHFVVLAARSTQELRMFCESGEVAMTQSLAAIDKVKQIGGAVQMSGVAQDSVFLMIDTRRFSQFSIEQFAITTRIAGFSVPGSNSPHSTALEMSFNVLDSTGISFANFLQYLMDKRLKSSFKGMYLAVRPMFIGHTTDGRTEVVQAFGIPAMFNTIQVDLNEVKGVYQCKLYPLVGMPSNSAYNAQWTAIGTASNYFTGVNENKLGAVIKSFEARLNDESINRYRERNQVVQTDGGQSTSPRFGRPVQYMITIPKEWEGYTFSGPSQGGAVEINFKQLLQDEEAKRNNAKSKTAVEQQKKAQANATAPAKDSFVAVDPTMTITEVLDKILEQTAEVQQLANFKRGQKTAEIKFYKHLVTITSDDESCTVHVDIVEFIVPNVELAEKSGNAVSADSSYLMTEEADSGTRQPKRVPKNFIEFDYIFSGKNIDVISLDLKIENLNLLLMQSPKIGQAATLVAADSGQDQKDGKSSGSDTQAVAGMGAKDPVPLPMLTAQERTNFSNLAANVKVEGAESPQAISQEYTRNLANFYNVGGEAKMTIRGNPDLLERVVFADMPQHVSAVTIMPTSVNVNTNDDVKKKWRQALEDNILRLNPKLQSAPGGGIKVNGVLPGPSFASTPVFVKVNVFGPDVNFMTLDPMAGSQNFAKQWLTDNYYFVDTIVSKIDGARFTQEFTLRQFSVFGAPSVAAQGQNQSTVKEAPTS